MMRLDSPDMPREQDLPILPTSSIEFLVAALVAESPSRPGPTDMVALQPVGTPIKRPSRPARAWLAAAAAVAVVGLLAVTLSSTSATTVPPAAGSGVGPANFPCGGELTSATAQLPGINYGAGPPYTMEVGIAGDIFCFRRYDDSAVPGVARAPEPSAPVPFFAVGEYETFENFQAGSTVASDRFTVAYAYGAVTARVDRAEFVPTATTASPTSFSTFYALADVKAFVIPFRDSGTINFYAGTELVDSKSVDATDPASSAGQAGTSDPAAPFTFVSADGSSDYSYPLGERPHLDDIAGPSVADPASTIHLDDYQGKAIVLTTWGSWCAPCRDQTPDLVSASRKYQDRQVQFVGIDMQDTRSFAAKFIRDLEIPFPSIFDPTASILQLAIPGLPTAALPSTIILDRNHDIAEIYLRRVTTADLNSVLDKLATE